MLTFEKAIKQDESGMASFVVVGIIISILAIITLSFTRIMNNEERQALDRELATQANYASESGLNDARRYADNLPSGTPDIPGCAPPTDAYSKQYFVKDGDFTGKGLGTGSSRYSCVALESSPKELVFQLEAGETRVFKVNITPRILKDIYFGWENSNGTHEPIGTYAGLASSFPRDDNKPVDATGVIRLGLYPITGGLVNNSILNNLSRNFVLYSNEDGIPAPGTMSFGINGQIVRGNCADSEPQPIAGFSSIGRYCNSAITGISAVTNYSVMFVRITAIYSPMTVSVMAVDTSGTVVDIPDVQAVVDVTGSGNDVIKRVRARVPLQKEYEVPIFGVASTSGICKLFRTPVIGPGFYDVSYLEPSIADARCAIPNGTGPIQPGLPPVNFNPPVITFAPGSNFSIGNGGSVGFSWTTSNSGGGCESSGTWGASQPFTSGSYNTGPLGPGTYTYSLTCVSSLGIDATASVTVSISPPACNVTTTGSRDPFTGLVSVTAAAGGCAYYTNNLVGPNGGGAWGPVAQPPGWCFTQQGGTDPWGYYASHTTCIP